MDIIQSAGARANLKMMMTFVLLSDHAIEAVVREEKELAYFLLA